MSILKPFRQDADSPNGICGRPEEGFLEESAPFPRVFVRSGGRAALSQAYLAKAALPLQVFCPFGEDLDTYAMHSSRNW